MRCSTNIGVLVAAIAVGVNGETPDNDWYRPPPAIPAKEFTVLPVEAEQVVMPVPRPARSVAIERLASADIIPLVARDCTMLGVPTNAEKLLQTLISEKQRDTTRKKKWLQHQEQEQREQQRYQTVVVPIQGPVDAIRSGIEQNRAAIEHWELLKGSLRPYLVRAVGFNRAGGKLFASLWRGVLTISESAFIVEAESPRHDRASIGPAYESEIEKIPVVVYLAERPKRIYNNVSVARGY